MPKCFILILFFTIFVQSVFSADADCNGTQQKPCIVQDTHDNVADAKSFHDVRIMAAAYDGDITGLADLWLSGSGRPNEMGFQMVREQIIKNTDGAVKNIIDLDLRKESHLYLNNNAIYRAVTYDLYNLGKTDEEALADQQQWQETLLRQGSVYNVLKGKQFDKQKYAEGITIPISTLTTEKEQAVKAGFTYVHMPLTTHNLAPTHTVDAFVELLRHIPEGTWLHVHCRGGNGRTTTFMIMYDMLHNADRVSFIEIIKRHAALPPHYNLFEIDMDGKLFRKYCEHRLKFFWRFYQFAKGTLEGYQGNWSDWMREHPHPARIN